MVDLSVTLEHIPHRWPWTSSLVSSLAVMLTKCPPVSPSPALSRSLLSAGAHVRTHHLTLHRKLSAHWNAARSDRGPGTAPVLSSHPTDTYFWTLCWRLPSGLFLFFFFWRLFLFLSLSSSSPRPSFHGHAGLRRACAGEQRTCWGVADQRRSTRKDPVGHSSCAQLLRSIRGESKLASTGRINTAEKASVNICATKSQKSSSIRNVFLLVVELYGHNRLKLVSFMTAHPLVTGRKLESYGFVGAGKLE